MSTGPVLCLYGGCIATARRWAHGFPLCDLHARSFAPDPPIVIGYAAAGNTHPDGKRRHAVLLTLALVAPPATRTGSQKRALCGGRITFYRVPDYTGARFKDHPYTGAGEPFDASHPRACPSCARILTANP